MMVQHSSSYPHALVVALVLIMSMVGTHPSFASSPIDAITAPSGDDESDSDGGVGFGVGATTMMKTPTPAVGGEENPVFASSSSSPIDETTTTTTGTTTAGENEDWLASGNSIASTTTTTSSSPNEKKACCLRPKDSQNDFEVIMMVSHEDFQDRKEYYAEFGKEMIPEGSMVLYKGKMGLLNADCSVTRMEDSEYGFPIDASSSSGGGSSVKMMTTNQSLGGGLSLPLLMTAVAFMTMSFLV